MIIKDAKFIKGIRGTDKILELDLLNLAFYGRSNVGKSSVINALLGRKNLVKSSSRPGKTKELNFFKINDEFFIVDLPGYGYAKVSPKEREKLRKLILWYILYSEVKNRINILVLDSKVGLTDYDKDILMLFQEKKEKMVVVFNKIDKLKQKDLSKNLRKIKNEFPNDVEVVSFSSTKKRGIEEFWKIFKEMLKK